jgi:hypothetical protein
LRQKLCSLLAQRKKVNYEPLNVADLVRVKIWRKGCKKALPEYSAETHSVVQILKSKYNWEEFKLSNGRKYTRDHVLKIPAGTESNKAAKCYSQKNISFPTKAYASLFQE